MAFNTFKPNSNSSIPCEAYQTEKTLFRKQAKQSIAYDKKL